MVANDPSASPSSWMPMSRALGAVFAGSAVMFGAALLQGGSLLSHDDVRPAAEPVAGRTDNSPTTVTAKVSASDAAPAAPNQATPWTPSATPDWGGPLRDLPVQRAPVRSAPQREVSVPVDDASQDPAPARDGSVRPTGDDPNRGTLGDVLDYIGP